MNRIVVITLACCFSLFIKAQTNVTERVYIHTDKESYIAGEDIWYKFFLTNADLTPSLLSKVGYIEVCDTEKAHLQHMVSLKRGAGTGKLTIPHNTPTGLYRLCGYTQYMRNEEESVFFEKTIAIINMDEKQLSDKVSYTETNIECDIPATRPNIIVSTDKNNYANRSKVKLLLEMLPKNIVDLTVSVVRNDSIVCIPGPDRNKWLQEVQGSKDKPIDNKILPEYEGHILTGTLASTNPDAEKPEIYATNIGFVGKDIRYINGMVDEESGKSLFFTKNIYGKQEVVTTILSKKEGYRIDLLSPYVTPLPEALPRLTLPLAEEKLMDRYIAVQLKQVMAIDSLGNKMPLEQYYKLSKPKRYILDEYNRFNTVRETFIEYIMEARVNTVEKKRRIQVLAMDRGRFNTGNTLVLLDGVPLADHDLVLNYNPLNVKTIDIYQGKYLFGNEVFESIVSFITYTANLSNIQLADNMQLLEYHFPAYPQLFESPVYDTTEKQKSLTPDFRHTLYFNAFPETIESNKIPLSFYTSDMTGEYKIVVEGFTKDGGIVYGTSRFVVKE